jgi:small subunit ribosomal protein S4
MKIGPKYKIARRVGAPIFEKTQTQKYAFRAERKSRNKKFSKPKSEYGLHLNEKQKTRFIYGLTERQFSNYVKSALSKKSTHAAQTIFESLESRIDNVVYRAGFAPTRLAARQMVSHGHITVNGKRITTPSRQAEMGDIVGIRVGSLGKNLFLNIDEKIKNAVTPSWIAFDGQKKTATIVGVPKLNQPENMFDLNAVIEFYSR